MVPGSSTVSNRVLMCHKHALHLKASRPILKNIPLNVISPAVSGYFTYHTPPTICAWVSECFSGEWRTRTLTSVTSSLFSRQLTTPLGLSLWCLSGIRTPTIWTKTKCTSRYTNKQYEQQKNFEISTFTLAMWRSSFELLLHEYSRRYHPWGYYTFCPLCRHYPSRTDDLHFVRVTL